MVDLLQSLLLEAADALSYCEQSRTELNEAYADLLKAERDAEAAKGANEEERWMFERRRSSYRALLEADEEHAKHLSITSLVTGLYTVHFADETHRQHRVIGLVAACCNAHRALREAYRNFNDDQGIWKKSLPRHAEGVYKHFARSMTMLARACNALRDLVSRPVPECKKVVKSVQLDTIVIPWTGHEYIPARHYLRPRYCFDWVSAATVLRTTYLTCMGQDDVVIEKLIRAFQRYPTTKPMYNGLVQSEVSKKLFLDALNAVWLSLAASNDIKCRNLDGYQVLYFAAFSTGGGKIRKQTWEKRFPDASQPQDPVSMAKGLRTIDINLGIIFDSDFSPIIWPLGKVKSTHGRDVVIFCTHSGFRAIRYEGVKLLEPGAQLTYTPGARMELAFSNVQFLDLQKGHQGMGSRGFLPMILSFMISRAKQTSPKWKPFPLLRLPPEIRNRIYQEYISHGQEGLGWNDQHFSRPDPRGWPTIPEICLTNHQLLGEVLPIYIAKKPLQVFLRKGLTLLDAKRPFPQLLKCQIYRDITFSVSGLQNLNLTLSRHNSSKTFSISGCGINKAWSQKGLTPADEETLRKLLTILIEDMTTNGLGIPEIEAIRIFLSHHLAEAPPKT